MSDIKDKREPEIKVPGLEERLAYILAHKGAYVFNKETETAGGENHQELPRGSIIYTDIASADNLRRYADGIGDFNPRFRDADYAKVTKYGRLIAQPTFLSSAAHNLGGHEEVCRGTAGWLPHRRGTGFQ